jgi:hypothetical protein
MASGRKMAVAADKEGDEKAKIQMKITKNQYVADQGCVTRRDALSAARSRCAPMTDGIRPTQRRQGPSFLFPRLAAADFSPSCGRGGQRRLLYFEK